MKLLTPLLMLFLPKLKQRERSWKYVLEHCTFQKNRYNKLIWFHAASMGEFEQAKPIIEKLKSERDDIQILCSFFSPSGYENQKHYKYTDAVVYMPPDSMKNVRAFLDRFQPDAAVFIRYEIWHNFLRELHKRKTPLFLVAATFPRIPVPLELVKQFFSLNFSFFDTIFTVDERHTTRFEALDVNSELITLTDPRFDRIAAAVKNAREHPILPRSLFDSQLVLVAGSCWEPDENILIPAINELNLNNFVYQCIFVPHEPSARHISELQSKVDSVLLSDLLSDISAPEKIKARIRKKHIVVDSIGKLLALYSVADAAYIGGAFGTGVHSVTEPAGYSIPIACGTNMKNSPDAVKLKELKALEVLKKQEDAIDWLKKLLAQDKRTKLGTIAGEYINSNTGSTKIVVGHLKKHL